MLKNSLWLVTFMLSFPCSSFPVASVSFMALDLDRTAIVLKRWFSGPLYTPKIIEDPKELLFEYVISIGTYHIKVKQSLNTCIY